MKQPKPTDKRQWTCSKCGETIATVWGVMDEKGIASYDKMLAHHEKQCKGKEKK